MVYWQPLSPSFLVGLSERRIASEVMVISSIAVGAVLALSAWFGYVAYQAGLAELGPVFAEGDTPEGALINSLAFLILVLAGAVLLLFLVRRRKLRMMHFLLSASLFLSSWLILEVYLSIFLGDNPSASPLIDALSLLYSLMLAFLVLKPVSLTLLDLFLLIYGTMAGALFATLLTPLSTLAVALTLAGYDLYSVTRGPLRKFLETVTAEQEGVGARGSTLRGAVLHIGPLSLGMGDVLVYSMLSPVFLLAPSLSLVRWAITSAALFGGFLATLKMLKHRKFMPALPLPVASSLAVYGICLLVRV